MAHLQAGEWQQAIDCFQVLLDNADAGNKNLYRQALDEARFKASIDANSTVRARRWILPWRPVLVRAAIILLLAILGFAGIQFIVRTASPVLAQAQQERQMRQLLAEGQAFLEQGDLNAAQARFEALLAMAPDHQEASAGLETVAAQRTLLARYHQAVAWQEAGDYQKALEGFTDLLLENPRLLDLNVRIAAINRRLQVEESFLNAETLFESGSDADAVAAYEQVRALDISYRSDLVADRLFDLYSRLGLSIISQYPPVPANLPIALDYFARALALRPRDSQISLERELAQSYLDGMASYQNEHWDQAIGQLRAIYDQRPSYLGDILAGLLYTAYVRSGDQHRGAGDLYFAYEQYRQAADLPVNDTAMATGRIAEVVPLLTPTATPTPTPTITPIPTATPIPLPTPILPTPTPKPLLAFRGKIVFTSANPDQPGLWIMDPDGANRQYWGNSGEQRKQLQDLYDQYQKSPDGRYRVYVTVGEGDDEPQVYIQGQINEYGFAPTWRVTEGFRRLAYDPVWSPDGSRIAFVSPEGGSDDIWVANVDGTDPRNLVDNDWEWDKRPTWSADSRRVVFWSNRTGKPQIFVMDVDGRNVRDISNTDWDETDPLWIR